MLCNTFRQLYTLGVLKQLKLKLQVLDYMQSSFHSDILIVDYISIL